MNIGENIKNLRKEKKISQEQLSEITGIPRSSIGRYERGEKYPNVKVLNKIAEALQIPMSLITTDSNYILTMDIDDFAETKFSKLNPELISLMKNNIKNNEIDLEIINKIKLAINILNLMNYEVKTDYKKHATIVDKSNSLKSFDVSIKILLEFGENINWSLDSFVGKFIKDNFN